MILVGAFLYLPPARGPRGAAAPPPLPGAAPQLPPEVPGEGLRRPRLQPVPPRQERAGKATHECWARLRCPLPPPPQATLKAPSLLPERPLRPCLAGDEDAGPAEPVRAQDPGAHLWQVRAGWWPGGTITFRWHWAGEAGNERRCPGGLVGPHSPHDTSPWQPVPVPPAPHAVTYPCHQGPMPEGS